MGADVKASGYSAVMASRVEPPDSLDDFPTPPWATRALIEVVLPALGMQAPGTVWEPAANRGLMAETLRGYAGQLFSSDIFDYGCGYEVADFLDPDVIPDLAPGDGIDWIITNPPFKAAEAFARHALTIAEEGVAILARLQWAETEARYELFREHPPAAVALFMERVPLYRGRWVAKGGKTATAYAWFVWRQPRVTFPPPIRFLPIPPGQRARLMRPADLVRFAHAIGPAKPDADQTEAAL